MVCWCDHRRPLLILYHYCRQWRGENSGIGVKGKYMSEIPVNEIGSNFIIEQCNAYVKPAKKTKICFYCHCSCERVMGLQLPFLLLVWVTSLWVILFKTQIFFLLNVIGNFHPQDGRWARCLRAVAVRWRYFGEFSKRAAITTNMRHPSGEIRSSILRSLRQERVRSMLDVSWILLFYTYSLFCEDIMSDSVYWIWCTCYIAQ